MNNEDTIIFNHLSEHVVILFMTLARLIEGEHSTDFGLVWKVKDNYVSNLKESHFVLGIGTDDDTMIVYNIPMHYWHKCNFANTLDKLPPKSLNHPSDMVDRLNKLYPEVMKRWE